MYRFFVEPEQLQSEPVYVTGEDYNHIKNVLRMTEVTGSISAGLRAMMRRNGMCC
jgi:16S rRNA U1498 N3-methylase RsmE